MQKNNLPLLTLFIGSIILFFACKADIEIEDVGEVQHYTTSNPTEIPPILPSFFSNGNFDILDSKIFREDEYAILSEHLDLPNLTRREVKTHFDFSLSNPNRDVNIDAMKATLGKVLFYDKELSIDGSTSCGSCHKQEYAFADDATFSEGLNENDTDRNSFALGSFVSLRLEYYGSAFSTTTTGKLFWDERADNFMDQMTQTFNNPKEMGIDEAELESRVNSKDYYNIIAKKAYGTDQLTHTQIKLAIAEFMSAIHTTKSPFDIALNDMGASTSLETDFDRFSASENLGKQLFNQNCQSCHVRSLIPISANNFIQSANNGLDLVYTDQGIGGVSLNENDNGRFKIPSLRNVAVTGPFMHDGRFETLEEVVDFYNDGIQAHPNLHIQLQDDNGLPKKLNLTNTEKKALLDFLNTLTDHSFLTNPLFKDPFKS